MVGGVERRAVADPRQRAQLSQQARRVGFVCSSRVRHVLSRRVCGAVLNAARDARLVPDFPINVSRSRKIIDST